MRKLFIFDTSVVLQAMLSRRSLAYSALRKADNHGIIVVSDATLLEFEEKMYLSKFDKYQSLPNRLAFFRAYRLMALNLEPTKEIAVCRDPKDDMFLSLALAANADCIISRDEDLLVLHPFENVPILNTPDFMRRFFPS
jgi:uncharacterized protein